MFVNYKEINFLFMFVAIDVNCVETLQVFRVDMYALGVAL